MPPSQRTSTWAARTPTPEEPGAAGALRARATPPAVIGWLDTSGRERNAQPGALHERMAALGWKLGTHCVLQASAMARRSTFSVDRILKGAKPGDLPIEQATIFDRVINLKTAATLGIVMPPAMRVRTTRLIE
jgi:ABC transporter substrate binding protein